MPRGALRILGMELLLTGSATAQSNAAFGELHGSVTDPSGALVLDAKITVTSEVAGNPFARIPRDGCLIRTNPPSQPQQFGGTLGPPLRKDRTFLFSAVEGLIRNESSVVSGLTDSSIFQPTIEQNAVLNRLPPGAANPLRAALTASQSTVDLFTTNNGVFLQQ